MKNRVSLLAALACLAMPVAAHAEDKPFTLQDAFGSDDFSIKGSFRLRYETYDNDFRPAARDGAQLLTLRTSIEADYHTGPLHVGGELRDVRIYLADKGTPFGNGDADALEPVQAYAALDLKNLAGGNAQVKAGRFLINLGSKRMVGDPGFRSAANAFTGVRFDWTGKGKQALTIFYTYPQQHLPADKDGLIANDVVWDREGSDLVFWGAFLALPKALGPFNAEVYTFGLHENDRPDLATRNRHLVTPGFRLYSKQAERRFDAEVEAAAQVGSIRTSTAASAPQVDVSAYMAHGEVGYTFPVAWSPRLALVGDIGSGDHAGSASYNRFDYLYNPQRTDWGPSGIYAALSRNNIVSLGARVDLKPGKRTDAYIFWRDNWLDSTTDSFAKSGLRDAAGLSGRHAGNQIEARVRQWLLPKQAQLEVGGAWLAKGRFLKDAPGAPAQGDTLATYMDLNIFF